MIKEVAMSREKKGLVKVMLDQAKFMEMLGEITQVAKVQENRITKEEIASYFADMDLQEEHFQHVYQYLGENGITVPGFLYQKTLENTVEEKEISKESSQDGEEGKKSPVLSMYMEDISCFGVLSDQEKTRLFLALREGDTKAKEQLLEGYLPVVVEMAQKYKDKGMPVEDLIQEGNIGLLQALDQVATISNIGDAQDFIVETIRQAMVEVVDAEIGANDWEAQVVAKTGLIHEASKYLAEDLGRVATVEELAEFTKLSKEEIKDILQLSLDAVKVGQGNA